MIFAKQTAVRSEIKIYFDMAAEGKPVIIPRKDDRSVVIISEREYSKLLAYKNREQRKGEGR